MCQPYIESALSDMCVQNETNKQINKQNKKNKTQIVHNWCVYICGSDML